MPDRISFKEGLKLLKEAPLTELQQQAQKIRNLKNPSHRVTFVLDSNPNYTNVCSIDCSFCAFYRHKSAKDAYTKTIDQVMQHFDRAQKAGLSTVLLQGGVNLDLKIDYYVNLVKTARSLYPDIHPHFFSAIEIFYCAKVSNLTVEETLKQLWDAGLRTIPGAGAEILTEKVRQEIAPKKMTTQEWLDVHHTAHKLGYRTTATMMYGHVEDPEDIVHHLESLRQIQDKIQGFTAFIPWSYKRERTSLRRKVKHWAGADAYFRILAFSRLYLDNFDHIGASWFSEGKENGIQALQYGADDFGGIIFEENVHRATGWVVRSNHNLMLKMIREAGFEPAQRNTFYDVIRTYEGIDEVEMPPEQEIQEEDRMPALQSACSPTLSCSNPAKTAQSLF